MCVCVCLPNPLQKQVNFKQSLTVKETCNVNSKTGKNVAEDIQFVIPEIHSHISPRIHGSVDKGVG